MIFSRQEFKFTYISVKFSVNFFFSFFFLSTLQYLRYKRDNINVEILLHILVDLVREASHLLSNRDPQVKIELKHLQIKVKFIP